MSTPAVSVVVPCRDCAHLVGHQLEALAAQVSDGVCEIIAVDDGSTDGTRDVLEAWRERLPALRIVPLEGGGSVAAARNAGLRAARAERILICDADDIVEAGWIEAMTDALDRHDLVGGPLGFGELNPGQPVAARPLDDGLPVACGYLPFTPGGNQGIWRSTALALGGWDESMARAEDQDFGWRAIRAGFSLGFAPGAVVQIRNRAGARAHWRQRLAWGAGSVELYVRHRSHMPARRRPAAVIRECARLVLLAGIATVRPGARLYLLESVAILAGRLQGSLEHRTLYL